MNTILVVMIQGLFIRSNIVLAVGAPAVAAPAGGDSDDDMFADSDTEPAEASKDAAAARPAGIASGTHGVSAAAVSPAVMPGSLTPPATHTAAGAQPADAGGGGAQGEGRAVESASASQAQDYSSWPISELRRVLMEAKIDTSGARARTSAARVSVSVQ